MNSRWTEDLVCNSEMDYDLLEISSPSTVRSERSLGLLTTKFVTLLQEAQDGMVNLKQAADLLAVKQKRRIYDITNVLEGIGLIQKTSKNSVQWTGAGLSADPQEDHRLVRLKCEMEELENKESALDQQHLWVQQSIRNTAEDCASSSYAYVNHEDICNCFNGNTLLVVRAPQGTLLDVPIPKAVEDCEERYQIHLKSVNGPIDVLLINKDPNAAAAVTLPVPPPRYLLSRGARGAAPHRATGRPPASRGPRPAPAAPDDAGADMISDLMASEVFSPLLKLSPPPSERDYSYNLDDSEGISDLFDVCVLKT